MSDALAEMREEQRALERLIRRKTKQITRLMEDVSELRFQQLMIAAKIHKACAAQADANHAALQQELARVRSL